MVDHGDRNVERLITEISEYLAPLGFESYPFKIGSYNDKVTRVFRLPYHDDTLAFVVLSTPDMFEKTFIPFIRGNMSSSIVKDPLDNSMIHQFNKLKQVFSEYEIEVLHDFELTSNRRPKIVIQTAGHVAGAAYHYQRSDIFNDPWTQKKIYGVSIHPKFGGWFGFRVVLIFPDVHYPNLKEIEPVNVVSFEEKRIELLENFNFHWRDSKYRDIIPVVGRYSKKQKLYFDTKPKDRLQLIEKWLKSADDDN